MSDQTKFVQAQNFALAGAGAIAGATSIVLKSFKQIDGTTNLTMTDFGGVIGFGTLEPGNGTLEEQICFTGVTQNSNGTATLTGVSTVLMVSPYTQTSGLAQTHAGSVTFVISNTSGFYDRLTGKADDETITGTWTFTNPNYPKMDASTPFPTVNEQLATKAYADSLTFAGAPDATTTQKGIVELATQTEVDAKTSTGGTGASLVVTPDRFRTTLLSDYVADTGIADTYAIAPSPTVSALTVGQRFSFKVANTNTGTATLVVNSLTGTAIFKDNGVTALRAGDLVAGQVVEVEYNGVDGFMLMVPAVKGIVPDQWGNAGKLLGTNGVTATWDYPYDYQVFTTTGANTWTKPSNLVGTEMVFVQLWGAGGGGASANAANNKAHGGGGGGGYKQAYFRASDLGATVTVTIGTGGSGGTGGADNATAGGNSTFGSLATAYGGGKGGAGGAANGAGGGGGGGLSVGGNAVTTTEGSGGNPGALTNGTSNQGYGGGAGGATGAGGSSAFGGGGGGAGGTGGGNEVGGNSIYGGGGGGGGDDGGTAKAGGTSEFGGSGGASTLNGTGVAGTAPGGGGGGTIRSSGGPYTGGAGARGECRVWVFK